MDSAHPNALGLALALAAMSGPVQPARHDRRIARRAARPPEDPHGAGDQRKAKRAARKKARRATRKNLK